jgi:hypothetical protein
MEHDAPPCSILEQAGCNLFSAGVAVLATTFPLRYGGAETSMLLCCRKMPLVSFSIIPRLGKSEAGIDRVLEGAGKNFFRQCQKIFYPNSHF